MWENNEYRMCFREDSILDFERAMLSSGECSYLLPMMFISSDSKHVVFYDCKGFVPLSRYTVDKTEDALFILEKVLIILSNALGYLITPAKISLSTDTVFYNAETGEIKIAYVPKKRPGRGRPISPEQRNEWEMRQLQKDFREWRGKALSDLNGDYRILTEKTNRFAPASFAVSSISDQS